MNRAATVLMAGSKSYAVLALAVPYLVRRSHQDWKRVGFFGAIIVIVVLQIAEMRWRGAILKKVTAALLLPVLMWNMYLVLFGNKDSSLIALEGSVVELESAVTCTVVFLQQDKLR